MLKRELDKFMMEEPVNIADGAFLAGGSASLNTS